MPTSECVCGRGAGFHNSVGCAATSVEDDIQLPSDSGLVQCPFVPTVLSLPMPSVPDLQSPSVPTMSHQEEISSAESVVADMNMVV